MHVRHNAYIFMLMLMLYTCGDIYPNPRPEYKRLGYNSPLAEYFCKPKIFQYVGNGLRGLFYSRWRELEKKCRHKWETLKAEIYYHTCVIYLWTRIYYTPISISRYCVNVNRLKAKKSLLNKEQHTKVGIINKKSKSNKESR